ncbi:hypothetical protein INT47_003639 [Mucor saturninus]|uniref:Uncharacterized protein n=1 Tax=Mucor saturninus TaxID=64648 RepID=A0A8H7RAD5_9FUNG|nr:hypothetical protein INT47_003639 [Mucor saturninus]
MSRTKNSILFYLVVSPLGYFLLTHLHHVLLPFNLLHKAECRNPHLLLETYSAPGNSVLDRVVCVLVRFCSQAINDPLCFPLTATLLGLATTSYAVMSVERVRFNNNRLLAPVMVFFGNVIGTGVIAPLAWLPIYGWTLRNHFSKPNKKSSSTNHTSIRAKVTEESALPVIEPNQAFGIGLAALFGQFLPVALLVSHGPSLFQRNILAAFQYFPITYALFEWIVPCLSRSSLQSKTRKEAKEGVRFLYVGIAGINAFLSYWVWIKWLQTVSSADGVMKQWVDLFFSFGSTGENPVAYMLIWDILAIFSTFAYWAWLEDGKTGLKTICRNTLLFGPGAGLALYAMKRESRI